MAELRDAGTRLDLIWSNPPVRVGKEALHQLMLNWLPLLADDGEAARAVDLYLMGESVLPA